MLAQCTHITYINIHIIQDNEVIVMPSRLILDGKVQGVFCRGYCSKYGKLLGISGVASNLPNGTVEVLLNTEDNIILENYITMLQANPRKIMFYGRIDSITKEKYHGTITGDYFF